MMTEKQLRADAWRILRAALAAADPAAAIRSALRLKGGQLMAGGRGYRLARYRSIQVIGAGKAGATMAVALEQLLGPRISGGLVNVKYGHTVPLARIQLNECGHPAPDENGVRGAERIAAIARDATADDLIFCLISGGASALLPLPAEGVSLAGMQDTTRLLMGCGASIHEINAVRKHLSAIKGGQLARLCAPATVIALLLSDVVGDDLDVIGSGPTAPDASTFADAIAVLRHYGIHDRVPAPVRARLESGAQETPKPGDPVFERVQNVVVASNRQAIAAAAVQARELGYRTLVLSTMVEGETKDVARVHAAIAREIAASGRPVKRPACVISGGETTVTLQGDGKGGRNQEFVLAAARDIAGLPGTVVVSVGTDGTDGPTDAAGAIADGFTIRRAGEAGLNANEALARNDSYPFFDRLGDLIRTGPTGTNVMDVHLVLAG